ncbi:hypothetical protein Sm713_37610 [Streptomyces sp. TS71-3]|nr:hypothetical protein Sm713_37610 [Streptomyces sp. TS71-3]
MHSVRPGVLRPVVRSVVMNWLLGAHAFAPWFAVPSSAPNTLRDPGRGPRLFAGDANSTPGRRERFPGRAPTGCQMALFG